MTSHEESNWELGRLAIFLTVAQAGSFTKAGMLLGLAQPAVSRQLARLETQCGGRLFERHGRGVILSELGQRILPRVKALLGEAQALTEEVRGGADMLAGDVKMGLLPSLHKMLTVPLFFELRSKYPLIKLQVLEGSGGQIDQWMADSHIDIGITYRYGNRPTSDVDTLATLDSYLIGAAGDRLTQLSEVRFAQLDGLPLVLPQAPSGVRMKLDRVAAQSRVSLNVVFGADSMQIQTEIVKEGGAYTVLPLHAVRSELESGALQAALIVDPPVSRTIALGFGASTVQSKATRIVARLTRTMIMSALS